MEKGHGKRPVLKKLDKVSIIDFEIEHEEYVRDTEASNTDKPLKEKTRIRSIKECIAEEVLQEIITEIEGFDKIEDEKEKQEIIIEFLHYLLSQEEYKEKSINLKEDLEQVRLDKKIENPKAQVMMLKVDLKRKLKENGIEVESTVNDPEKFGDIVKSMINNGNSFYPREIRGWIYYVLKSNGNKLTLDELSYILEEKLTHLKSVRTMRLVADSFGFKFTTKPSTNFKRNSFRPTAKKEFKMDNSIETQSQRALGNSKKEFKMGSYGGSNSTRGSIPLRPALKRRVEDHDANDARNQSQNPTKKVRFEACWGCGQEGHELKNCRKVVDARERERIASSRIAKVNSNTNNIRQYLVDSEEGDKKIFNCRVATEQKNNPKSGLVLDKVERVLFNGIEVEPLFDNGSDRSLVSLKWVQQFQREYTGKSPSIIELENSIQIKLLDPRQIIETKSYVEFDLTFKIYDNLFLRKRKFFIIQEDIGVPLVGHNELAEIGIDTKSTLERLGFRASNEEIDEEIFDEEDSQIYSNLDQEIEEMLKRAKSKGMPRNSFEKLEKLIWDYKDIFRTCLMSDPPAKVTPMDVDLKPGAHNVRWNTYNIKYSQEELNWLKKHIKDLEKYGYIYRNTHARHVSPALVVEKPGKPGEYRLCVDVKKANTLVNTTHWPMPQLDVVLRKLGKSKVYAKLDAFKGYWMFPVTPKCGQLYSIKTPFGVFTPTRIVQGAQESVKYFQAGMEEALNIQDRNDILLWVDDILAHTETAEQLLESLKHIFQCCRERKICLSAKKCDLFLEDVTWCGRTISEKGVGYSNEYIQGILDLEMPKTVGDLQQFICSMNWVRSSIPNFITHMEPLSCCLQSLETLIGTTKKKVLQRRNLSQYEQWNEEKKKAFTQAKELLKSSLITAHYDPKQRVCIFPDASDNHWGLFITQVPHEDLDKEFEKQRHSPLVIMSGSFKNSSKRWHIKEKEAYPIMVALSKTRDILKNPDGFSIFSDHKNLVYILDPQSRKSSKLIDGRLSRWSMTLMNFKFTVEHISGENNVVADMLSRWKIAYPQTVRAANFAPGQCSIIHKEDFIWPDILEIKNLQSKITKKEIRNSKLIRKLFESDYIYMTEKENRIYIPNDENLKAMLCVIAHTGLSGHRGIQTTMNNLNKFYWPNMINDVKKFCTNCLHCAVADPRQIIPRPFGQQMHAKTRNEILHYDFIQIGPSYNGFIYLLVIKDDFSGYINLIPCESPTSEVVVNALLQWYGQFGIALCHISDQGSHFKNEVLSELNRRLTTKHKFTLPYTPWSNGTIEVVNREIRKLIKVWCSEFRIQIKDWPNLIPLILHVLNFSVSPRTGYPPALIFGGFQTNTNLDCIFTNKKLQYTKKSFDDFTTKVSELKKALDILHKEVEKQTRSRGHYTNPGIRANFALINLYVERSFFYCFLF